MSQPSSPVNTNHGQSPMQVDGASSAAVPTAVTSGSVGSAGSGSVGSSGSGSGSTGIPVPSSPHVSSRQQVHDSLHALRRALGNEIARRVAAVTGGDADVIGETGARISFLKQEIESMQELAVLVAPPRSSAQASSSSSAGSRIPPGLPYMQWTGYVWCNEYHTYPTMQECLLAFEDIIRAASCDINQVWHKYLPIRLSPEHRSWFGDNLARNSHLSWNEARAMYEGEFAVDDSEYVARCVDKFMSCRQAKKETISEFTARFQKLRRDARLPDDQVAVNRYLSGLLSHIADRVNTARAPLAPELKCTVQQVSGLAHALEDSFVDQRSSSHGAGNVASSSSGSSSSVSSGSSLAASRHAPHSRKRRASSASTEERVKKHCDIHGKGNHSTEECRKRQHILKQETVPNKLSTVGDSSRGSGSRSAGAGGSGKHMGEKGKGRHFVARAHKHVKDSNSGSTSSAKGKAVSLTPSHASRVPSLSGDSTPGVDVSANQGSSVAVPVSGGDVDVSGSSSSSPVVAATSVSTDTPSSPSLSSALPFAESEDVEMADVCNALAAPSIECKSHTHSQDDKHSRSPYFPIIIEGHRLWALLDTGATDSTVSPSLCDKFGWSVQRLPGTIKLAVPGSSIDRIGITNKLSVTCNNRTISHAFEVMPLHGAADVCIGNDIKGRFGIHLVGLPISWEKSGLPQAPSPIVNDAEPNNDPAGSLDQHNDFMSKIQPHLQANEDIPITSFCTLKESVVRLRTPPGTTAYRPQYPIPLALQPVLQKQIEKWLNDGVIKRAPIDSSWNSPITFAPKKDAQGNFTKFRPCLDPRHINRLIPDERSGLPKISEIFQKMQGASVYTTLDLTNAFHRFKVHNRDQHKLSFTFNDIKYCFIGCPFGLKHISERYNAVLKRLLYGLPYVASFVDDIVIFSNSLEEHAQHVQTVIDKLTSVNLILNREKCHFAQRCVYLLGYCVSAAGRALDPRKVTNVSNWPTPKTGNDIQRFLGAANFFGEHIPCYSSLSRPLNALRNAGDLQELWTSEHDQAFQDIKTAMQEAPVLSPPDLRYPFCVATDASKNGIGAVLYQVIDDRYHYIGFMARSLTKSERNYSTTKRELLAIVYALRKYHQFLWGKHFKLYTDHKALVYLHTQPIANPMMVQWLDVICDYDFVVAHLPGVKNVLPDRLSRLFTPEEELEGGNTGTTSSQKNDSATTLPHDSLQDSSITVARLHHHESIEDMMTPPEEEREELLRLSHLKGHFGADAIVSDLHSEGIHWSNMKRDAQNIVSQCLPCQKINIGKHGYHPLRHVTSNAPGDHWAIDLGELPASQTGGYTFILVMVDVFSRYCVLRPLLDKTAPTIAKTLISVFGDYGFPKVLQSDNGTEFVNTIIKTLTEVSGMDHRLITPYHPRGNGVAERWVGTTKQAIVKLLQGKDNDWDLYVPSLQLFINSKHSPLHGSRPFSLMFARQPNKLCNYTNDNTDHNVSPQQALELRKEDIEQFEQAVIPAIKERMQRMRDAEKARYDSNNRIIKPLPIGTKVVIKNVHRSGKTEPRYTGPFRITGLNQGGAYTLADATGETHTCNVPPSHIKVVSDDIDLSDDVYEVEQILDHKGRPGNFQYLIKWKGYSDAHNTWEPQGNLNADRILETYWHQRKQAQQDAKVTRAQRKRVAQNNASAQTKHKRQRRHA